MDKGADSRLPIVVFYAEKIRMKGWLGKGRELSAPVRQLARSKAFVRRNHHLICKA
jgi:hypothetical protein